MNVTYFKLPYLKVSSNQNKCSVIFLSSCFFFVLFLPARFLSKFKSYSIGLTTYLIYMRHCKVIHSYVLDPWIWLFLARKRQFSLNIKFSTKLTIFLRQFFNFPGLACIGSYTFGLYFFNLYVPTLKKQIMSIKISSLRVFFISRYYVRCQKV